MRLHEQYRLLQQHYGEQPVSPGVAELAALLACSPRNVRLQLAKMQQQGWLAWQPGRGRGHRSVLQCLQPPQDLQWQRTHRLLQRGELEQAFASLPPDGRSQLMAQLPAYLGASANRRQLRIPIHRPLATLDPLRVTSRLEAHLVRQVFDRLCSFDIATQTLQPALAHSWQADASARQWRFWLRPGVQFHDGSPLDAWAVAASVQRLHEQAGPWMQQYRGLRAIRVHDALSLSFELADTDWLWPQRLITANASIVPVRRGDDFAQLPVGSGPFRVARHSAQRLSLEANLRYYRERPLLDGIDLWVLAAPAGADFHLRLDQPVSGRSQPLQSACTYLLANTRRPWCRDDARRRALLHWLSQPPLVTADDPLREPASGLLPDWQQPGVQPAATPLPAGQVLTLVTYELASFQPLAQSIADRLAAAGVGLRIRTLDYPRYERFEDWWHDTDLVLSSEVLHDDRDYSCYEWLGGNPLLRAALGEGGAARMAAAPQVVQATPAREARMQAYQRIADWLVAEGWLLPLSHERQGVAASPRVGGLALGLNGWMDFASLWLHDDDG